MEQDQNNGQLQNCKQVRTAAKTRLTLASNKLKELVATNATQTEIRYSIEGFERKLKLYDDAQMSLEQFVDIADLEAEVERSEIYKEQRISDLCLAKDYLHTFSFTTNESDMNTVSSHFNSSVLNQARLPQIELPKFWGDHTQWQSFWDKFNAIVHTSDTSTIAKFSYLQSLLKGDALSSINGLSLTESNYQIARQILEQRFGRKEKIVFCHIQQLLNLSFPGKSTNDLWALHDKLQTHIRSLESLGISGDTYGVILTPLVLHKLPEAVRLEWARLGEGKECDLEALLSFLHSEILRRERSQTFRDEPKQQQETRNNHRHSTASALHVGRKEERKMCAVCDKWHNTEKCFSWNSLSLEARKNVCFEKGLCFLCLGKHRIKECKSNNRCKCSGKHHSLLCNKLSETDSGNDFSNHNNELASSTSTNQALRVQTRKDSDNKIKNRQTVLQMAQAVAVGMNGKQNVKINLLFDSGSDRSYVSKECVKKLGLNTIGKEAISVVVFGQDKPSTPKLRNKYNLELMSEMLGKEKMTVIESPTICAPIQRQKLPQDIFDNLRERGLKLADASLLSNGSHLIIDVLVGLDYFWNFVKPNVCKIMDYLSAQETKFGWIVSGSWEESNCERPFSYQFLCRTDTPDNLCHKLWDLDTIGIMSKEPDYDMTVTDAKVLENFNETIRFDCESERYVVQLPWKPEQKKKLKENKACAVKRYENLARKLKRDPVLEQEYSEVFHDLEHKKIIHEVPTEELEIDKNPVFYLPHRPVVREGSTTTKVRPVFDASTRDLNGLSLNDCLEAGPNLIPNLTEILMRFRRWKFGLTADISKAFLQIRVAKEDQDVHRFIWDVNNKRRVMRFDRVIFGNVSSPFLLNATVKYHLNLFPKSKVVNELGQNLYVDDWLSGADSEEEIELMAIKASEIMNQGGFPLAKWGSNSLSVSQKTCKDLGDGVNECCSSLKILGIQWSTENDCFFFETTRMFEGLQFTKRLVLSFIARIYDPLGFLNPFTVMIKILFQDMWRQGFGWDEPLPHDMQTKMSQWVDDFKEIRQWKIPRCISIESWTNVSVSDMKLLAFSDASERAFGCCIYLKVCEGGIEKVSLIASKVRVAPLKKITLPRMELLGALLAARLLCFVRSALLLPIDTSYACYTDSTIVLHWIRADPSKWKQFVRNRVVEIQELTSPSNWNHVPGKDNPADLVTRGVYASELASSKEWLQGPVSLVLEEDSNLEQPAPTEEEVLLEKGHVAEPVLLNVQNSLPPLIDFKRYSNFTKVVKVMGWVLRFTNNLKLSLNKKEIIRTRALELDELHVAKVRVFTIVQKEFFEDELNRVKRDMNVIKGSPLFKYSPFVDDDGLLRAGGRLDMSNNYTFNEKHPIVLPKCHVSLLLTQFQHCMLKHAGVSVLLTSLRNDYLIIGMRVLAKKVCRECVVCQKQNLRACSQAICPLPVDRISRAYPFSVVGVDHAGPLYCEDTDGKKHYILLFTCGVIRAVHLELVDSLSLSDFMLAFRKFSARRGLPSVIYSDNAKTFRAALRLVERFGPVTPQWKFSIPLAPWYGGWWERLVRSTKSALKKSLGRALVSRLELETTLVEVEACLNSRPLTYVGDHGDPLTPSLFLLGRNSAFCPMESSALPQTSTEFHNLSKGNHMALEKFWKIWSEDYLRNLPSLGNGKSKTDLCKGSIVLIRDEGRPRMSWPLGRVTELIHSKDGLIRAVNLKTMNGNIVRPVQNLYKLEVGDYTEDPNVAGSSYSDSQQVEIEQPTTY